jgi:BirA family biotin operon repressor/biotin-[acetyl-CoA-carboxylase] ligase
MEDSLSPLSITRNLETRIVGREVICYPSAASTNELAKEAARQGVVEGTVIIAEEQTAGRGRRQRSWLSPRGGIALSVVLYPSRDNLPSLIMLASLAVARSIAAVTALKPQIKWPNDVLISDRKVCGILVESEVRGDKVDYAVIGIGVNVNLERASLAKLAPEATSLAAELGREVSIRDLIRKLLMETDGLYLSLRSGGSVYEKWCDSLVTLGREVRVESGGAEDTGIAESVARDGSLLLRRPDGSLRRVVAGDVSLRRR